VKGVINILKPPGMTSHDVVNFLRRLLKIKKIGHSGTLDPAAAGVLPIFIGKATKAIEFFVDDDKEYIAEIRLGITTDTGDFEGNITNINPVKIDRFKFKKTIEQFTGDVWQVPPMYSAVRYKGRKLYEYARQGVVIERKPRKVKIYSIDLLDYDEKTAIVRITCSKGTYIRTLCEDIGKELGCGACLSCLVRVRSGQFIIEKSATLEEIQQNYIGGIPEKVMIPIDKCFKHMPMVRLHREDRSFFIKGKMLFGDFEHLKDHVDKYVRVYNFEEFLGIAIVKNIKEKTAIKIFKSLN
jgi:tRNA pseudouridine55 synthase